MIKVRKYGHSITWWLPGNESELTQKLINNYLIAKKMSKANVRLLGFFWMQGETDTYSKENAEKYGERFRVLINYIRKETNQPFLPVVYGRTVVDYKNPVHRHVFILRKQQEEIKIKKAQMVDTDEFKRYDGMHLTGVGQVYLAKKMSKILYEKFLNKKDLK